MAEAIAAAAAAVGNAVVGSLTAVGVSYQTALTVGSIAAATVTTLAYVGPALLFRPNIPTPEFARQVKRQPIPDRQSGYGLARIGGAYMLYEVAEEYAVNVFAMHDGLIAEWKLDTGLYLNDEIETLTGGFVNVGPDLRYGKFSDLVRIETRLGMPTETSYTAATALLPTLWPANARGDGVASLLMIAKSSSKELFLRDYPNGLPIPSAVGSLQYCWDPRLGARGTITNDADKEASATWVGGSRNPVLQLLDYMTNPSTGMGLPLSRFASRIADWELAADVCDELVALAAGGTVERYLSGGMYVHSTPPADVIATILATCDGWISEDANGVFTVQAGKYYAPTVTITDDHIVSLSRQFWQPDEQAVNEMVVSYTEPAKDYSEVETDAWRSQSEIDAIGGVVRSQRLSLPWVQNNSQARRLAKIALTKASAPVRGTITTTLEGLKAWDQRRIRIQAPLDSNTMADIVVDILPITLNADRTVSIPFVSCDPTAYDWDSATEEGAGAGDDVRPPPAPAPVPEIFELTSIEATSEIQRLRIEIDGGTVGGTYIDRWRVFGSDVWTQDTPQIAVAGTPHPYIETGVIPAGVVEVQVAFLTTGGIQSEWSDTALSIDALISESGDTMIAEDGSLLIPE